MRIPTALAALALLVALPSLGHADDRVQAVCADVSEAERAECIEGFEIMVGLCPDRVDELFACLDAADDDAAVQGCVDACFLSTTSGPIDPRVAEACADVPEGERPICIDSFGMMQSMCPDRFDGLLECLENAEAAGADDAAIQACIDTCTGDFESEMADLSAEWEQKVADTCSHLVGFDEYGKDHAACLEDVNRRATVCTGEPASHLLTCLGGAESYGMVGFCFDACASKGGSD